MVKINITNLDKDILLLLSMKGPQTEYIISKKLKVPTQKIRYRLQRMKKFDLVICNGGTEYDINTENVNIQEDDIFQFINGDIVWICFRKNSDFDKTINHILDLYSKSVSTGKKVIVTANLSKK